jgi:hypothetical protein
LQSLKVLSVTASEELAPTFTAPPFARDDAVKITEPSVSAPLPVTLKSAVAATPALLLEKTLPLDDAMVSVFPLMIRIYANTHRYSTAAILRVLVEWAAPGPKQIGAFSGMSVQTNIVLGNGYVGGNCNILVSGQDQLGARAKEVGRRG